MYVAPVLDADFVLIEGGGSEGDVVDLVLLSDTGGGRLRREAANNESEALLDLTGVGIFVKYLDIRRNRICVLKTSKIMSKRSFICAKLGNMCTGAVLANSAQHFSTLIGIV